jgi:hypothetical protein
MTTNDTAAGQKPQRQSSEARGEERPNLSYRYGTIGIEAVAAAVRYAGSGKTPAEAPVAHRIDQRFLETAV